MQVISQGMADHLKGQSRIGSGVGPSPPQDCACDCQIGLGGRAGWLAPACYCGSMLNLRKVDLGFRSDHVLIARLPRSLATNTIPRENGELL